MNNHHGTQEAFLDIDGNVIRVKKAHVLSLFEHLENWIKIPDFIYQAEFTHMVLDPDAHKTGSKYLVLPIIKPGAMNEVPPVLSSYGYLGLVTCARDIKWHDLSADQKSMMQARYPQVTKKVPHNVGQIDIVLLSPVHNSIKAGFKKPDSSRLLRR